MYIIISEKRQVHRSHVASNKYRSLHRDLCNTWQISQFTTQINNKAYKTERNSFWYFYQTIGEQQEI